MEFYPFPALLRAEYNDIHTYGLAKVAARENALEFTGDFIPLLPLNAEATVDWVYGDRTLASFAGKVYLSSPGLLRLVELDPQMVAALRGVFALNTRLPATATVGQNGGTVTHPVEIVYLSGGEFTLHTQQDIAQQQIIHLNAEVDFLTLSDLALFVRRRIALRRGDTLLLCEARNCSDANFIALSAYSSRLERLE